MLPDHATEMRRKMINPCEDCYSTNLSHGTHAAMLEHGGQR